MKATMPMLCLLLAACTTVPQNVIVPKEVDIPVVTRCKVVFPKKPADLADEPIPPKPYEKTIRVLREDIDYRNYSKELEATLKSCADPV